MEEHPIEGLMITAMNSIQDMVDVNTIIGEPIETSNNVVVIPISKVTFGFAAGGSEFKGETIDEYTKKEKEEEIQYRLPFGGGSGAGVNISPEAFLIIQEGQVKLLPVNHVSAVDKLIDYVPDLLDKINKVLNKQLDQKQKEQEKNATKESITKENDRPKVKAEKIKPQYKENWKNDYEVEYDETEDIVNDIIDMENFEK